MHEKQHENSRFFGPGETVPAQALTLGMNLILNSKKVILMAEGASKSEAIGRFVNRPEITTQLPASFLWIHNDVTVIVDASAARDIDPATKTRSVVI